MDERMTRLWDWLEARRAEERERRDMFAARGFMSKAAGCDGAFDAYRQTMAFIEDMTRDIADA